jgi:hypothetical protein
MTQYVYQFPNFFGTSPEVLTNSQLFVRLDIPNEREAVVDISLIRGWRFLPFYLPIVFFCTVLRSTRLFQ